MLHTKLGTSRALRKQLMQRYQQLNVHISQCLHCAFLFVIRGHRIDSSSCVGWRQEGRPDSKALLQFSLKILLWDLGSQ